MMDQFFIPELKKNYENLSEVAEDCLGEGSSIESRLD